MEIKLLMMQKMSSSIKDLDEADAESVFRMSGYLARKGAAPESVGASSEPGIKIINGKVYRKTTADKASWLR